MKGEDMYLNERIKTVIPMLEAKGLYGTVTLIRDLKKEVDNNQEIRNQAITEFAERLKIKLGSYYDHYMIDEVAEEMKGGAIDG